MKNVLSVIYQIVTNPVIDLDDYSKSKNRANIMGDSLEKYVSDLFSGCDSETDANAAQEKYAETFSYIGNTNNPPDLILTGGDAIEIKKIESLRSDLALNSSYPKSKLHNDDPRITNACKVCDGGSWNEKDIVYTIGAVSGGKLRALWMVYGNCYAADREVYLRLANKITSGIQQIGDLDSSDSKELGRVNRVDPLGITYLRIRGMWGIQNPIKVYQQYNPVDVSADFSFCAIMTEEKFNSFEESDRNALKSIDDRSFQIEDIKIKAPNNPATLLNAKLIKFKK